jgi:hypothetical protein
MDVQPFERLDDPESEALGDKLLHHLETFKRSVAAASTKTQQNDKALVSHHEAHMLYHKNKVMSLCAMELDKMHQMVHSLLVDKTKFLLTHANIPAVTPTEKEYVAKLFCRYCQKLLLQQENVNVVYLRKDHGPIMKFASCDLSDGIEDPLYISQIFGSIRKLLKYHVEKGLREYRMYRNCPTAEEHATILHYERSFSRICGMVMREVDNLCKAALDDKENLSNNN